MGEAVLTHQHRKHLPTSCPKTGLPWQPPELLTHATLVCPVPPGHGSVGWQGCPLQQDLGMQSSACPRPRKRRRGPALRAALQLWEICCLSELPSSFSTQDTVPWCHGGGESQTGCLSCPWQLRAPGLKGTEVVPGRCGPAWAAVTPPTSAHHTSLQGFDSQDTAP